MLIFKGHNLFLLQHLPKFRPSLLGGIWVDVLNGHGQQFFPRVSPLFTGGLIDTLDTRLGIMPNDGIGRLFNRELRQIRIGFDL